MPSSDASFYTAQFYDVIFQGSKRSADVVLPLMQGRFPGLTSVVDVGCGAGAWLMSVPEWECVGIDGPWAAESFAPPWATFIEHDLGTGEVFRSSRKFDLAISLEVGEHLPESAADSYVDTICNLSDLVLFSAAIPGQGGTNHINEQPHEYWNEKFRVREYEVLDIIRPLVASDERVEPWYRQNMFVMERR